MLSIFRDPFYLHVDFLYELALIPLALINHLIPNKVWDEITYLFPNFKGSTVDVSSTAAPLNFGMDEFTYPCWS